MFMAIACSASGARSSTRITASRSPLDDRVHRRDAGPVPIRRRTALPSRPPRLAHHAAHAAADRQLARQPTGASPRPRSTPWSRVSSAARRRCHVGRIYASMTYDGEAHVSLLLSGDRDRLIHLDGASKSYAMTSWRLGWSVAEALRPRQARGQRHSASTRRPGGRASRRSTVRRIASPPWSRIRQAPAYGRRRAEPASGVSHHRRRLLCLPQRRRPDSGEAPRLRPSREAGVAVIGGPISALRRGYLQLSTRARRRTSCGRSNGWASSRSPRSSLSRAPCSDTGACRSPAALPHAARPAAWDGSPAERRHRRATFRRPVRPTRLATAGMIACAKARPIPKASRKPGGVQVAIVPAPISQARNGPAQAPGRIERLWTLSQSSLPNVVPILADSRPDL